LCLDTVLREEAKVKNQPKRRPIALWLLLVLLVVMGVSSVFCGAMLVAAPDGSLMRMPPSNLGPFSSFLIPGLLLLVFLGFYPLVVVYALWARPGWRWPQALHPFRGMHWAWAGSLAAGAIVLTWIVVEMILLRTAVFLHWLVLGWGLALIGLTLLPAVRREYGE